MWGWWNNEKECSHQTQGLAFDTQSQRQGQLKKTFTKRIQGHHNVFSLICWCQQSLCWQALTIKVGSVIFLHLSVYSCHSGQMHWSHSCNKSFQSIMPDSVQSSGLCCESLLFWAWPMMFGFQYQCYLMRLRDGDHLTMSCLTIQEKQDALMLENSNNESKKPSRKRNRKKEDVEPVGPSESAADGVKKMLDAKKLSSKVNYANLDTLFDDAAPLPTMWGIFQPSSHFWMSLISFFKVLQSHLIFKSVS